jgi:type I restriction enzyme M protein
MATARPSPTRSSRSKPPKDGKDQLKSYTHATGAPLALWSNGVSPVVWHRKNPNYFVEIPDVPTASQTIDDPAGKPWTIDTLIEKEEARAKDGLRARDLRQLIEDMEDEVLANAGVDVFEEVFKLIFTKLYDELACHRGIYPHLRFRNSNTAAQLKANIQSLFDDAKKKWPGVFNDDERIRLTADHLQVCVGSLEEWKLSTPTSTSSTTRSNTSSTNPPRATRASISPRAGSSTTV